MGSGIRCDMCIAIRDSITGQRVRFTHRFPYLNVSEKNSQLSLLWGRKEHETIALPLGGWLREDLLERGDFSQYFPKSVRLLSDAFCQYDFYGRAHWFQLVEGDQLACVALRTEKEQRLYLRLILSERHDNHFLYWPKLMKCL